MKVEFKRRLFFKNKMYAKGDVANFNQFDSAYLEKNGYAEKVVEKDEPKSEKEFKGEKPVTKEKKAVKTWKDDK